MPIISVKDHENIIRKRNAKTKKMKEEQKKGDRSYSDSKHVAVKCRYLKIWDLLSFLICSSILVLKWRQVSSI